MIPRCAWNCKILKTRQKKKYWRGNYWILILRQWTVLLVRIRLFSWLCPSEQTNPRKIDSLTVISLLLHWIFLISSQSKTRYCLLSLVHEVWWLLYTCDKVNQAQRKLLVCCNEQRINVKMQRETAYPCRKSNIIQLWSYCWQQSR